MCFFDKLLHKAYTNVGDLIRNDMSSVARLNGAVVATSVLHPLSCVEGVCLYYCFCFRYIQFVCIYQGEPFGVLHFANIGDVSAFIARKDEDFNGTHTTFFRKTL
jgi:hypothetical protein